MHRRVSLRGAAWKERGRGREAMTRARTDRERGLFVLEGAAWGPLSAWPCSRRAAGPAPLIEGAPERLSVW